MSPVHEQLHSIQAMLTAGHRSVRLERHSLLLRGGVGGFLIGATDWIITIERFPEVSQRALVLLLWLSVWLGGMSLLDHWLSRRRRQQREESLPFAQAQITRAWWMLLSIGTLSSFAMFFYGGGAMIYSLWIVLLGLGIYLFGLFSRPLIEWIGLATILLGVLGLASGLPHVTTRWLGASCFALGMPLCGWLAPRIPDDRPVQRIAALLLWLGVVVTPPLLSVRLHHTPLPDGPDFRLEAPISAGPGVLLLPAGTPVKVRLDFDSPLVHFPPELAGQMQLSLPLAVAMQDGVPEGRFRFADGEWRSIRDGVIHLNIDRITPQLDHGQPEVQIHGRFHSKDIGEQP
ncbi:MAG: hypothetical protein RIR00_123 [Pseudomonadota bacterium]|jgi:hypothetical protein